MIKLNTKMPDNIKILFQNELNAYAEALENYEYEWAWHHLERAHIIGQRYPLQHTITHWKMLCLGFIEGNLREMIGQVVRLLLGAPFSFINKIPVGNVGSTRVSMIKPQKIPEELEEIF